MKSGCFLIGKLNLKYSIIFFTSTIVNTTPISTTGVLQFISFPQMKQDSKKTSLLLHHNH